MKNISICKMQFTIALCLIFNCISIFNVNAHNNFCDAIPIEVPSSKNCQEITQSPQSLGDSVFVNMSCDMSPTDGIQNSKWFRFEVFPLNELDILINADFDFQWSLYSYTGTACPFEIDSLIEIYCSINNGFYKTDNPGIYYLQIDGYNNQFGEVCIGLLYLQVQGCTDPVACNYNPEAIIDDGSCLPTLTCNSDICLGDIEIVDPNDPCNCIIDEVQVLGCTDPLACNFDPPANCDNGSCNFGIPDCPEPCNVIYGCTDSTASNYDQFANCDNDSCIYPMFGSIGDHVWYDANTNGIQDAGEVPVGSGVLVIITGATIGIQTQITNNAGFYNFTGLTAGTYTVIVGAGPPGSTLTTPKSYTVNLGAGQNFVDADFGFKPFFTVNVTAAKPTVCSGDSTKVEAFPDGGIPPYTYLWNTGDTTKCINAKPNTNTIYSVTVTDSIGCVAMGAQKVYVSPFGFISQPTNELIVRVPDGESIDSAVARIRAELDVDFGPELEMTPIDTCDCDGLILLEFPDVEEGRPRTILDMEEIKETSSRGLGPEGNVSVNQKICYWEPISTESDTCSYTNADDVISSPSPIVIGLIDSGIDDPLNYNFLYKHQEMGCANDVNDTYVVEGSFVIGIDRFDYPIDIEDNIGPLQDEIGHGTFISNIIAKDSDNLDIFVSKYLDQSCSKKSSLFNAICSIEKMEEYNNSENITDNEKIKVLNLSMGYYGPLDTIFYNAIKAIGKTGTTVVCSAGNGSINLDVDFGLLQDTTHIISIDTIMVDSITMNLDTIQVEVYDTITEIQIDSILLNHYPSEFDLDNIISVAAWDFKGDSLAYFSNYGPNSVDLVAPGIKIKSKIPKFLDNNNEIEAENGDGYDVKSCRLT